MKNIWREDELTEGELLDWDCGILRFSCKIEKQDFWLRYRHYRDEEESRSAKAEAQQRDDPAQGEWRRWTLKKFYPKIKFEPLLPDRPVVIKPESPFLMAPGSEAKIYVRCPLWVALELLDRESLRIDELPTVVLSDTWFGDFFNGELCYWISSAGRRMITPNLLRPYLAICPIRIMNDAAEELNVEKICLRALNHALYADQDGQLWAAEALIHNRGPAVASEIAVSPRAPAEARGARLVREAREVRKSNIFARTFAAAKSLQVFGNLD